MRGLGLRLLLLCSTAAATAAAAAAAGDPAAVCADADPQPAATPLTTPTASDTAAARKKRQQQRACPPWPAAMVDPPVPCPAAGAAPLLPPYVNNTSQQQQQLLQPPPAAGAGASTTHLAALARWRAGDLGPVAAPPADYAGGYALLEGPAAGGGDGAAAGLGPSGGSGSGSGSNVGGSGPLVSGDTLWVVGGGRDIFARRDQGVAVLARAAGSAALANAEPTGEQQPGEKTAHWGFEARATVTHLDWVGGGVTSQWQKAGVILRGGGHGDEDAPYVMAWVGPGSPLGDGRLVFHYRASRGAYTAPRSSGLTEWVDFRPAPALPLGLRVRRMGDVFTADWRAGGVGPVGSEEGWRRLNAFRVPELFANATDELWWGVATTKHHESGTTRPLVAGFSLASMEAPPFCHPPCDETVATCERDGEDNDAPNSVPPARCKCMGSGEFAPLSDLTGSLCVNATSTAAATTPGSRSLAAAVAATTAVTLAAV